MWSKCAGTTVWSLITSVGWTNRRWSAQTWRYCIYTAQRGHGFFWLLIIYNLWASGKGHKWKDERITWLWSIWSCRNIMLTSLHSPDHLLMVTGLGHWALSRHCLRTLVEQEELKLNHQAGLCPPTSVSSVFWRLDPICITLHNLRSHWVICFHTALIGIVMVQQTALVFDR